MVWHALATYDDKGNNAFGLVVNDRIYTLADLLGQYQSTSLHRLTERGLPSEFTNWADISHDLSALAEKIDKGSLKISALPAQTALRAPFIPPRIFAAASNYIEHSNEMGTALAAKSQSAPYVFMKASTSVVGHDAPIILPPRAQKVDWEVELAAVLGQGGRDIPVETALKHVVAYTVMNDISARDLTKRTDFPFSHDWFQGKSFDTFGPLGPWLVPASLFEDPQRLNLSLHVSGKKMQSSNTSEMIFTLAEQISYLSTILTLQPGDLIATGTPDGVGMGTGTFLKDGDIVEAFVENIGLLRNPVMRKKMLPRDTV